MKCGNCGKVSRAGAKYCSECGTRLDGQVEEVKDTKISVRKRNPGMGTAGFIVGLCGLCFTSVIMSIVGLVFSAVALKGYDPNTQKRKGLLVAGLVLSIVGLVFSVIKTAAEWYWQFWIF